MCEGEGVFLYCGLRRLPQSLYLPWMISLPLAGVWPDGTRTAPGPPGPAPQRAMASSAHWGDSWTWFSRVPLSLSDPGRFLMEAVLSRYSLGYAFGDTE